MNLELRVVAKNLGLLALVLAAIIAAVGLFAWCDGYFGSSLSSADVWALLATAGVGFVVGGLLFLLGRNGPRTVGQREAIALVAFSWILGAGLSALPYRLWAELRPDAATAAHDFDSGVNCFFESMSGLTTTGSTILQSIVTLPRSLLLWRSITHWLGGLGIVVLFVAVLPMMGVGGRRIFRIEAPGPSPEGVTPRIQDAARVLWLIYSGITLVEIVALRICGMSWFDSVCHTFATLATGGFSTHDASIAGYASSAVHIVIIVFMVLAGINFGLYHQLWQGRWRAVRKDPELRVYLGLIVVATVIVTVSMIQSGTGPAIPEGTGERVRDALFQVVAIQTTTGFCTADFDQWGFAAKVTLVALMFIGGSAGSTGGGIKVARIMIAFKVLVSEIEHVYRPNVVRPVKIGKSLIDAELKRSTLVYVLGIVILFAMGSAALMFLEANRGIDITTAATASASMLNNIGPGLARVGPMQNYAWFSDMSKMMMSMLMLLGRLEVFTVVAVFSPRFWREE